MRVLTIIPARAGSKRLPQKNVRDFCGKSLTILACEQAMRLKDYFEDVVLTTNDRKAISQGKKCGVENIRVRPDHLCDDSASSESAIEDAILFMGKEYDKILLLEVTSPLRTDQDIIESLKLAKDYPGVKSVTEVKNCLNGEIVEPRLQLNGAIHIWDANWIREVPYTRFALHHMPPERSIHIDYEWEFDTAEMLYRRQYGG